MTALRPIFDAAVGVIDGLPSLGSVQGPLLGELEFWRDVVPEDRLKASK